MRSTVKNLSVYARFLICFIFIIVMFLIGIIFSNRLTGNIVSILASIVFTTATAGVFIYLAVLIKAQAFEKDVQLSDVNARARIVFEKSPVAIVVWDASFNPIDLNDACVNLFGMRDKSEYIENSLSFSPEFQPCGTLSKTKAENNLVRLRQHGNLEFDWMHIDTNGNPLPCYLTLIYIKLHNDSMFFGFFKDMRNEENNLAKSRFLARMSHEIRTPITAIIGISEIYMQKPNLPSGVEEAFSKIYDSTKILFGIIDDILDISKIEAGKMEIICNSYEVSGLVVNTMQMHLMYANGKTISFEVYADENMPSHLFGDELRIKQIINNILSNAIKYTDEGTIKFTISCEYQPGALHEGGDVNLIINVSDSGKGMSADQVRALHDEYVRFHEMESRFIQGSGLGMPIVYNLVDIMNGNIHVESAVGKGTSVTVTLPQKIASDITVGYETSQSLNKLNSGLYTSEQKINIMPQSMPYGRVLVVDDVDANLYVAEGLLSFYNLKIETECSGQGAIERIKRGENFDVIFMDHMMPEMNGVEAAQTLRNMGYNKPIVAFTANALVGQDEEFLKHGFDGFISKPIQLTHLDAVLNKFVRDKHNIHEKISTAEELKKIDNEEWDNLISDVRDRFADSQSETIPNIRKAYDCGDTSAARVLAHALKGLAFTINESELGLAAKSLESMFAQGRLCEETKAQIEKVETLLKNTRDDILNERRVRLHTEDARSRLLAADMENFEEILTALEDALTQSNAASIEIARKLHGIPQADLLVKQVENLDFESALKTLTQQRTGIS